MTKEAPETVVIPSKHKPGSKGPDTPYKSVNRAANGLRVDGNESKDIALWMGTTPSQDLSHRAAMPPTLPSDIKLKSEEASAIVVASEQEISPGDKDGRIEDADEDQENDTESGESDGGLGT